MQEVFLGALSSNMHQQLLVVTVLMSPTDDFAAVTQFSAPHLLYNSYQYHQDSFAIMCRHTCMLCVGCGEGADMACFMVAAAAHEGNRCGNDCCSLAGDTGHYDPGSPNSCKSEPQPRLFVLYDKITVLWHQ